MGLVCVPKYKVDKKVVRLQGVTFGFPGSFKTEFWEGQQYVYHTVILPCIAYVSKKSVFEQDETRFMTTFAKKSSLFVVSVGVCPIFVTGLEVNSYNPFTLR